MNFNDAPVVSVKGSSYRIHFSYISKNDAISITNNYNLINKKDVLLIILLLGIRMSEKTYYKKKTEM